MRRFSLYISFYLSLFVILTACGSQTDKKDDLRICKKCNMELPKSNIHTAIMIEKNENDYFDDIGCLVLWAKTENIDLDKAKLKVFANDTHRYIDIKKAFYSINEKTPMSYGFSAYENEIENSIDFNEVRLRMLRGEHMANPKIRKHILGY
jgi:hypothetical protein